MVTVNWNEDIEARSGVESSGIDYNDGSYCRSDITAIGTYTVQCPSGATIITPGEVNYWVGGQYRWEIFAREFTKNGSYSQWANDHFGPNVGFAPWCDTGGVTAPGTNITCYSVVYY